MPTNQEDAALTLSDCIELAKLIGVGLDTFASSAGRETSEQVGIASAHLQMVIDLLDGIENPKTKPNAA